MKGLARDPSQVLPLPGHTPPGISRLIFKGQKLPLLPVPRLASTQYERMAHL